MLRAHEEHIGAGFERQISGSVASIAGHHPSSRSVKSTPPKCISSRWNYGHETREMVRAPLPPLRSHNRDGAVIPIDLFLRRSGTEKIDGSRRARSARSSVVEVRIASVSPCPGNVYGGMRHLPRAANVRGGETDDELLLSPKERRIDDRIQRVGVDVQNGLENHVGSDRRVLADEQWRA